MLDANDFKKYMPLVLQLKCMTVALMAVIAGASIAQPMTAESGSVGVSNSSAAAQIMPRALTAPTSSASAAEIQMINENMTVLAAQLMQLDLQAKIAAKRKEIIALQAPSVAVASGVASSALTPLGSVYGTPSVVSVSGLKGNLEALLVFSGGLVQRVRAGDVLGDRKVRSIAINNVELTDLNGKNLQRLAFGTTAVNREVAGSAASPSAMPAMPAMPMGFPTMPVPNR